MEFDLKTASVLIGTASAAVGLAFKLMPRSSDRLKRDLELLKLTREAKANHLPLQRRIDAQINEEYVKQGIGFSRYIDIVSGELFFAIVLSTGITSIIGAVIALGSLLIVSPSDNTAAYIFIGFAMLGLVVGLIGGMSDADKRIAQLRNEINERERLTLSEDEEVLRRIRASDSTQVSPGKEDSLSIR
jgi:VIT1/CCC1 family predicted Fe2+/Mn2+ transporter